MLRPVFMGYTTMGYSMGSILRAILGRPYDPSVLMTPAATLQVCGLFKSAYFDAKARSSTEVADNPWDLQSGALFSRLDAFLERCRDLLDLFRTVVQFRKLERIEIGGNKGRSLSASVVQIYSDFNGLLEAILNLPYDVLDVEVKQFDYDFYPYPYPYP